MLKRILVTLLATTCFVLAASLGVAAETKLLLDDPLVQVVSQEGMDSCAFAAGSYDSFNVDGTTARLVLQAADREAASHRVLSHGVKRVSWEPVAEGLAVEIEFNSEPEYYVVNAMPGTEMRPGVEQVIAAFSFPAESERKGYPVMGTGAATANIDRDDEHGTYELPKFPPVKYSDALVTLKVHNTDFRDVLWLLSEIGGVSIVLDPYWDQEPTGSTRPPGGPGGNTGGGGSDGGDGGFRPGGSFDPIVPRDNTGSLTLNFRDVPFDTALELVLLSVGLVKTDIYPGS